MKDLCFIDCETTGLDPSVHEAIEWAVVRVNKDGTTTSIEMRVKPNHIERADSKALEINGYTEEAWVSAASEQEAVSALAQVCRGAALVGHSVGFDERFLRAAFTRCGVAPTWGLVIDTLSLAWPLYLKGEIPRLNLASLCEWAAVSQPVKHRAMADVLAVREVYNKLVAR